MPELLLRNKFKIFLLIIGLILLIVLIVLGFNFYSSHFKNQELRFRLLNISRQLVSLKMPSSLPEGKRESEKQGINNTGIPRLQRAVDALRSGDIAKAGEMIADEIESLQLTSSDMLRRYSNLKLDANGDRMVDYLEEVYNQLTELKKNTL